MTAPVEARVSTAAPHTLRSGVRRSWVSRWVGLVGRVNASVPDAPPGRKAGRLFMGAVLTFRVAPSDPAALAASSATGTGAVNPKPDANGVLLLPNAVIVRAGGSAPPMSNAGTMGSFRFCDDFGMVCPRRHELCLSLVSGLLALSCGVAGGGRDAAAMALPRWSWGGCGASAWRRCECDCLRVSLLISKTPLIFLGASPSSSLESDKLCSKSCRGSRPCCCRRIADLRRDALSPLPITSSGTSHTCGRLHCLSVAPQQRG